MARWCWSAVYIAISRFGVRLPLKPFFGVTSAFLYYMAFVFAGKGVAELQEGGVLPTTIVSWAPRVPALGIYPTVESLAGAGRAGAPAHCGSGLDLRHRAAPADEAPACALAGARYPNTAGADAL